MSDTNPITPENLATNSEVSAPAKRPWGTLVLAGLLLLSGLAVGGQRLYQLSIVFSHGGDVVIHQSVYVSLARDMVTAATAIFGGIGLILGLKFGWWFSLVHAFWRLAIQSVLPLLGLLATPNPGGAATQSQKMTAAVVAGVMFSLIALYLQKKNVISYFAVRYHPILTNVGLLVLTVVVAFGLDLWWAASQS